VNIHTKRGSFEEHVIPAKAGTRKCSRKPWIPAKAGMTHGAFGHPAV
jgi:hypothetical protein